MPILLLPLFEIIGLIVIGGNIGLFDSLLWLTGSAFLGFYLLKRQGLGALLRAKKADPDAVFTTADLFNQVAVVIAGLLLVFPGFISDFLAVPFLIAPLRHWVFRRMKDQPDHFIRRRARERGKSPGDGIVIDAEDIKPAERPGIDERRR